MSKMSFDKTGIIIVLALVAFFIGRNIYFKPDVIYGDQAPNFTATTISNERIQLKDFKGNYVLLDFWGSWCGPCRKENPDLVNLYKRYHNQAFEGDANFEILSVGIESNKDRWKNAIEKDGLTWEYHVSDLKEFENEVANLYGVKSIPSKFLINPDGMVVGVNQSLKEVDQFLSEKLLLNPSMSKK